MYSTKPREHLIECEPLSGESQRLREELDRIFTEALAFIDIMGVTLEEGETDPREGPKDELRKVKTILHELGKLVKNGEIKNRLRCRTSCPVEESGQNWASPIYV